MSYEAPTNYLTLHEVAKRLHTSYRTVHAMMREGEFQGIPLVTGRGKSQCIRWRISERSFLLWQAKHVGTGLEEAITDAAEQLDPASLSRVIVRLTLFNNKRKQSFTI